MKISGIKRFIFSILIFLPALTGYGQPHIKGVPFSLKFNLKTPRLINIEKITFDKNIKQKNTIITPSPARAGLTIRLKNKNIKGKWEYVNGFFVWKAGFKTTNAKFLNVYFKNLRLKKNDRLYIYSPETAKYKGAFTFRNNGEFFTTGLLEGNTLVIEYSTNEMGKIPFEINEIGIILNATKGFGDAGECEVAVNCSEGLEWKNQKNGVARILVKDGDGLFWCTGSLINNTAQDWKPYILTANHCGRTSTPTDYLQWVFDFKYESEDCSRPETPPVPVTFSGSSLIANGSSPDKYKYSDFKLLLLKDTIPGDDNLYYNGWDRSGATPSGGVTIHHPQGDITFISTYDNAVSSYYYGNENPEAPFWKVTWIETEHGHGVTEGGSSGSPLFNEKKLITGTLTGGDASCDFLNAPDYFGKFSDHWDKNGSGPERQLKPWLDPENTGVMTLNGSYKNSGKVIPGFESDVTKILNGSYVNFINTSQGNIIKYKWIFEGGNPAGSDENNPPLIKYDVPGKYDVTLYAFTATSVDTLVKHNYITVLGSIYPNPVNKNKSSEVTIPIGDTPAQDVELKLYNNSGKYQGNVKFVYGYKKIIFNASALPPGVYILSTVINNIEKHYKFIILP